MDINEISRFVVNGVSYFGKGARKKIGYEVKRHHLKKAFVVTDKDLVKFGVTALVTDVLKNSEIEFVVFDDVKANPSIKNVQLGVDAFKKSDSDCIVAVGGGSVIDTAKGIGIIANNEKNYDVVSLEGCDKSENLSVFVFAVPTTAGTGSETTMDYVITNEAEKRKMACMDINAVPVAAFLDSEIMASLPKGLTAATAMDALTHAIESFTSKGAWEISDAVSLKAIELIGGNIIKALDNSNDYDARNMLSLGQFMAGMSFTNVGLGIVHSMAHPLSAYYDIPHGIANAMILPWVMEFNTPYCVEKMKKISSALGYEENENFAHIAVRKLLEQTRLPLTLKEAGVLEEDLEELSKSAFNDVSTGDNPRGVSENDILELYNKIYE